MVLHGATWRICLMARGRQGGQALARGHPRSHRKSLSLKTHF